MMTQQTEYGPTQQGDSTSRSAEVRTNTRGHLVILIRDRDGEALESFDFGAENTVLVRELLARAKVDLSI